MIRPRPIYGLLAEFDRSEAFLAAIGRVRREGYTRMEAFTPHPLDGLSEVMDLGPTKVPLIVLIGAIVGALTGYFLQLYANGYDYPINVGGRPLNSWPAFIPITFEMAVLFASISAVLGMLALNGLPAPYHPVFNVPEFALASRNRFFLCIEARDENFDRDETWRFLEELGPRGIWEVAR
jgi:hypothetical protein